MSKPFVKPLPLTEEELEMQEIRVAVETIVFEYRNAMYKAGQKMDVEQLNEHLKAIRESITVGELDKTVKELRKIHQFYKPTPEGRKYA